MSSNRELIRDFHNRILGSIETNGDQQIARDFYGKIVGKYSSSDNKTRDFYGRIVTSGNSLVGLIMSNGNK